MPAINGVDDPAKVKKIINENHNGKGPYYIAEWYPAWFDWWGASHHTVAAEKYVGRLDTVLAAGISINMYMFHGGTTRAFMNGANYNDRSPYEPQITSYDYDAPLDEAGNATDKFMKFREVIQKHLPVGQTLPAVPAAKPTMAIAAIGFNEAVSVLDNLPKGRLSDSPLTFEDLNQDYGYVLYRTKIQGGKTGVLKLSDLRDYAVIMVNGKTIGTLDRRLKQDSLTLTLPAGPVTLDILVENMGRINFGKYLLQNKKGITKAVFFNGTEINKWQMFGLPLSDSKQIAFKQGTTSSNLPTFKKGTFNLQKVADTYIDLSKWGKGVVWVNGHNLGRYWNVGPEQTLYLPAEWLKKGANDIVVFELLKPEINSLSAIEKPILDIVKR
ncbi:glycosyl hydrolase family 35 [Mucilaginibacter gracilis]|uniref:Glycosyl hydrolase family 35 n=2 Tax=Mucilaginibacter gracilis TaxID=423350 RepID=A0A495J873_9SPHI|nr:glycosyl hydrolase family 35 [Mucilaginibacter gracilis]